MSRLVVVSNRVADLSNPVQAGGLVVALADALSKRGGVWFGWNGDIGYSQTIDRNHTGNVERVGLTLSQSDFDNYYAGYANSVLWPLFHYRLDLIDYRPSFFRGYRRVNERFAKNLAPMLEGGDHVWVHDYHLLPLAQFLRRGGVEQPIGLFLHIPFPPPEILAAAPNHAFIVEAMLEYDVLGFQTSTDVANFRRYIRLNGPGTLNEDNSVTFRGRTVRAARFPIGIDVDAFGQMARHSSEEMRIEQLRRQVLQRKQIIGVDRLDYSKGIPARFQAFERLLVLNPEHERRVSMLQVAPPTRGGITAYDTIRSETEGLAGSINGRYAEINWTPIHYIHRTVPRDQLAALYRTSEVGFVTPLRDGMNLVAKEYVAAQDADDPGVLVLSQFAGAAEEMAEALIVNPHDIDEMAMTLHRALTLPLEERRRRHAALLRRVHASDVAHWARSFLEALAATPSLYPRRAKRPRPRPLPAGPGGLGYIMTLAREEEEILGVGSECHQHTESDEL